MINQGFLHLVVMVLLPRGHGQLMCDVFLGDGALLSWVAIDQCSHSKTTVQCRRASNSGGIGDMKDSHTFARAKW